MVGFTVETATGTLQQRNGSCYRIQSKAKGESWEAQRAIQGRITKHALSSDDRERQMFEMRPNGSARDSSQKREPSGQPSGESSSALRFLPLHLDQKAMVASKKEIDIACKRISREYEQLKLFPPEEKHEARQMKLEDA